MDYKKIKVEEIDLNLARKISKEISKANRQLPFKVNENNELVVLVDKLNKEVKTLEFFYSLKIKKNEISIEEVDRFIEVAFLGKKEDIFNLLINKGIKFNASDIHFEPGERDVLIRYRIDGKLIAMFKILKEEYERLLSEVKVKGNMDITEKSRHTLTNGYYKRF